MIEGAGDMPLPPAAPAKKLDRLWIDLYAGDYGGFPPWEKLCAWEPAVGIGLKACEGTSYRPAWFQKNWNAVRRAYGELYGVTRFRQPYTFLRFDSPGALQADYLLKSVELAGGWGPGDLPPSIDFELGGAKNPNRRASRQQIIDCVSSCAERLVGALHRPVIGYGIGILRDLKIKSGLGCHYLWLANYGEILPASEYTDLGWIYDQALVTSDPLKRRRLMAWQYCGAPEGGKLAGYPVTCPNTGQSTLDLSTLMIHDLVGLAAETVTEPAA